MCSTLVSGVLDRPSHPGSISPWIYCCDTMYAHICTRPRSAYCVIRAVPLVSRPARKRRKVVVWWWCGVPGGGLGLFYAQTLPGPELRVPLSPALWLGCRPCADGFLDTPRFSPSYSPSSSGGRRRRRGSSPNGPTRSCRRPVPFPPPPPPSSLPVICIVACDPTRRSEQIDRALRSLHRLRGSSAETARGVQRRSTELCILRNWRGSALALPQRSHTA